MLEKIRKIGAGEVLLAVVVILGIIGTISFFFLDYMSDEQRTRFIIWSSLAFIGSFFVLSIYARAIKSRHNAQFSIQKDLANWMAHYFPGSAQPGKGMPANTVERIALYLYRMDGFRMEGASRVDPGIHCLATTDGQRELIQCWQATVPVGLREVVRFYEALRAERAARGEIWSVNGFSAEAAHWVMKKPIVLVSGPQIDEIARGIFLARQVQQK